MKFLTFAILPAVALAQSGTPTKPDMPGLTKALNAALASASACTKSVGFYMNEVKDTTSLDTGCAWLDSQQMPPLEKVLDETVINAAVSDLAVLTEIKDPLISLIDQFDRALIAAASKQEALQKAACEFINKDHPNLGANTVRTLQKLAKSLERGNLLPNQSEQLNEWANKLDAAIKAVKPTCGQGGSPAPSSTSSLKTGSFTSATPTPSPKPGSPGFNIVTAGASSFVPHVLALGVFAIGAAFTMH